MHGQLLLWNYSDALAYEAAGRPFAGPCVHTSRELAFPPQLPSDFDCSVSQSHRGWRSWPGPRAGGLLAQLSTTKPVLTECM